MGTSADLVPLVQCGHTVWGSDGRSLQLCCTIAVSTSGSTSGSSTAHGCLKALVCFQT